MVRTPIVFIIGAGASHPYHFPLGAQLVTETIVGTQQNSHTLFKALLDVGHTPRDINEFNRALREANPASIDQLLRSRADLADIGKQAIVQQLMLCEDPHRVRECPPAKDWLRYLTARILHGESLKAVEANLVTFVTFNFDRLLEFTLIRWMVSAYGATLEDAARVIRKFGVIHVHGQLGALHGLQENAETSRHFGPDNYPGREMAAFAKRLHIIGDGVGDEPTTRVRAAFGGAKQVCFLGFGYDRTNMKWLRSCGLDSTNIVGRYGTRVGLTDAEARAAVEAKVQFLGNDVDALAFLRNHAVLHDE